MRKLLAAIAVTTCTTLLAGATLAHAQSWTPGPSFAEAPAPRLQAAAVYYLGSIYVLGGTPFDTTSDQNGSSDYLNYGDVAFTIGPALDGPYTSQGAGIDALGRPIVFGGTQGGNGSGPTYVFDPTNGRGLTTLPSRSTSAPAANFAFTTDPQGRIYSIGGGPGEAATASKQNSTRVERFDAIANAWAVLAPLPVALANAAAAADGAGHVIVVGGINSTASARVNTVYRYDIATSTWSSSAIPPMPQALSNARAVQGTDQNLYVIGGKAGAMQAGTPVADVWVLDERTNTWSAGASMSSPRADPAVIYSPDYAAIFAMGGDDGAGGSFTSEMLTVVTCPTFSTSALSETLCAGRTAAFQADAQGDAPITYKWRRNGAALSDGATGTGSVVSGANTNIVTITNISNADAATYDAVASNTCGQVASNAAALRVTAPPSLPGAADWTFTEAAFSTHSTTFNAITRGVVSGGADAIRTSTPAKGRYFEHGFAWDGIAGDATSAPPNPQAIACDIFAASGPLAVGYYQYLIGGPRTGLQIQSAGCVWGTVNGVTARTALTAATPLATDGTTIVGGNGVYAYQWTAPGAAGPWTSSILGVGQANAVLNGRAFGASNSHATIYNADHTQSDLNPFGSTKSELVGTAGLDQCGDYLTDAKHAALWHGLPIGVTDLSPAGSDSSWASVARGAYQAGDAFVGGFARATIWGGSAGRRVDLAGVAGSRYMSTWAKDMEVDSLGDITVVGGGVRAADSVTVGLIWNTAPYAEIVKQPVATRVLIGRDTSFTAITRANGTVSYQWRHDGVPLTDDGRITGAHTAALHIAHAAVLDAGLYTLTLTNAISSATTLPESLTVLTPLAVDGALRGATRFAGAAPSPVHGAAAFRFALAHGSHVKLALYDLSGRLVRTLVDESRVAGSYEVPWDASTLGAAGSGVLFARFEADGVTQTRKVAVIR